MKLRMRIVGLEDGGEPCLVRLHDISKTMIGSVADGLHYIQIPLKDIPEGVETLRFEVQVREVRE